MLRFFFQPCIYAQFVSVLYSVSVSTTRDMEAPVKYKQDWDSLLRYCKQAQGLVMGSVTCLSPSECTMFLVENLRHENYTVSFLKSKESADTCFQVSNEEGPFNWVLISPRKQLDDGVWCSYEVQSRKERFVRYLADNLTHTKTRFCADCGLPLMKA